MLHIRSFIRATIQTTSLGLLGLMSIVFFVPIVGFTQTVKRVSSAFVPNQLIVKFKNEASSSTRQSFWQKYPYQVLKKFQTNGALLVQLPEPQFASANSLLALSQKLAQRPEIDYVEPNWIVHSRSTQNHFSLGSPNDPLFDRLYALRQSTGVGGGSINAPEAWSKTTGSPQVLVAIIDSGIDYTHQDLAANYWSNPGETGMDSRGQDKRTNGIDDDRNGKVDDWRGWNFLENNNDPMDSNEHGTHCAGTIGAVGNNGLGTTGVNWSVSLVGLKFINRDGSGTIADAIAAVEYAISLGAHVINNSWGGDEYSETMAAVIRKADAAGILFVVAAGNDSNNNDIGPDYPASYDIDNVISVGAVDSEGQIASFSNFGPRSVHIAAPGVQILSTVPGNNYAVLDGTSMAAPYVSGAAALVKSRFPQLSAREIKARLLGGAVASERLAPYIKTGVLNVNNALNEDFTPPPAPQRISVITTSASFLDLEWEQALALGSLSENDLYGYELRYSSHPISTEADWQSAAKGNFAFGPNASNRRTIVTRVNGFPINAKGYLTVRAFDRSGNWSPLTMSIPFALQQTHAVYSNSGNTLEGLSINGNWNTESLPGIGTVLSDSPSTTYGFGETTTLMLPPIKMMGSEVILTFSSQYDFELGYDFGFLEISFDEGRTWNQAATFNGTKGWQALAYSILPPGDSENHSGSSPSLLIRFRITSDRTTSKDGWYLANIAVYSP